MYDVYFYTNVMVARLFRGNSILILCKGEWIFNAIFNDQYFYSTNIRNLCLNLLYIIMQMFPHNYSNSILC